MTSSDPSPDYDPARYDRPSVTVDLVLIGLAGGELSVLLKRRTAAPQEGRWALLGGFVRIDETLEDAANRVLREKTGLTGVSLEQLYTFGAIDRDPRMRIISVAYMALFDAARFARGMASGMDLGTAGFAADGRMRDAAGTPLPLAFDHAMILGVARDRLRGKIDYSDIGFALLPERFTLRQLQDVHEAILSVRLNKPAFRRRMLDRGWLVPTGEREPDASHRPAELFRYRGAPPTPTAPASAGRHA